ncbi:MAG: hypothetical protein IM603_05695, partial [Cytophagales bacterium]|nr:hypothetical protein [Cytophagales bacterium]
VSAGGAAIVNGLAATALADDAFLNTTNAQVSVIYTVVPVSAAGCQGASFTVTVPVDPQPVVAVQTRVVCSETALGVNFNPSSTVAAATYNVTGLNLNGLGVFAGAPGIANNLVAADLADDAFINTTANPVNVTYTVVPVSSLGCQGTAFTVTVTVNPKPIVPAQTPSAICSGSSFTVTPVTGGATVVPAGTTYTWTAPTISPTPGSLTGASGQALPQTSISQTLNNTTTIVQTAVYTVTPTSGAGCVGSNFNITLDVNPKPVIANRTATICSGDTFTVSPVDASPVTIVPFGTTYAWGIPSMTPGVAGGTAAAGQASISQTLTNSSTATGTATYTVTPTSTVGGTCVGSTFQVVVTVQPIPKLSSTLAPTAICSGTFNYTATSATAGASITWTRANFGFITESATAGGGVAPLIINETLTNTGTSFVDVTYNVITTANGCSNGPAGENVVVRVQPTPVPNPIIGPAAVCVSPTTTYFYQVTQVPGSTYSWNVPAGFTVQAAGGGAVAGGGLGPASADYFILLRYLVPTTQTLSVTEISSNGCVGLSNSLPIVVSDIAPPGIIASTSGATTFCKNQTGVVFQVPQNANSNFIWSTNSGATIRGPSAGTNLYQIIVDFNTSATATINVTEINLNGCPTIYPGLPIALLDPPAMTPASGSICSGSQPSSVITLSTTPAVPSTFSWIVKSKTANILGAFVNDTGTGPLTHFPSVLTNNSGFDGTIVYTVTPTGIALPNCIGSPIDITVTVKPEPVIASISNQSVCPLTFVNGALSFPFSNNLVPANNSFSWTNSNPAIGLAAASGSGNISFTSADNQTGVDIVSNITVTTTANGCTSSGANAKSFTITLKPRPVVAAITDIVVCPGDAISIPAFTANTSGGETYAWTNDNTAIGLVASGSGNISGYFAPSNNTGVDLVGNISVAGSLNSCTGLPQTFKIIIKPEPVVASIANQTFC